MLCLAQPKDIDHVLNEVIVSAGAYPLDTIIRPPAMVSDVVARTNPELAASESATKKKSAFATEEDALTEDFFIERTGRPAAALPGQTTADQTAAACLGYQSGVGGQKRNQPAMTAGEDIFHMDSDLIVAHNLDTSTGEIIVVVVVHCVSKKQDT